MDFGGELTTGDSLTGSPTVTATVWSGNDSDPSAIVSSSTVDGTEVEVVLTGGVDGTIYEVSVSVGTAYGYTLVMAAYLAVVPNVP